jgi:hypothetical protein
MDRFIACKNEIALSLRVKFLRSAYDAIERVLTNMASAGELGRFGVSEGIKI